MRWTKARVKKSKSITSVFSVVQKKKEKKNYRNCSTQINRFCEKSQPLIVQKKLITVFSVNDNEIKRNDEKEVNTKWMWILREKLILFEIGNGKKLDLLFNQIFIWP